MLYREIMAVCSEIHTKHTRVNTAVCVKWRKLALNLMVRILTTAPYSGSYYLQFDWQLHTYKLTLPLECMAVSLPNKNFVFFNVKTYAASYFCGSL